MNAFFLSYATAGSARLACNWLLSLQREGIDDLGVLYCGDTATEEALSKFVRVIDSASAICCPEVSADTFPCEIPAPTWGTTGYSAWALGQVALVLSLMPDNNDPWTPFLFCDAGSVVVDDPTEFLNKAPRTLLFGCQSPEPGDFCPGLMFLGKNERALFQCVVSWLSLRLPFATGIEGGDYLDDRTAIAAALEFFQRQAETLEPEYFPGIGQPWDLDRALVIQARGDTSPAAKEARFKAAGLWFAREPMLAEVGL